MDPSFPPPSRSPSPTGARLFEVWLDLTAWLMQRTARFPKRLRHTLTDRIDQLAIQILEELTVATWTKHPVRSLRAADQRLTRLRVLLRLSHELRLLSDAQLGEATARLSEAGRMLGGWLGSLKTRTP